MANQLSPQEISNQAKRIYQNGDFPAAAQAFAEAACGFLEAGDASMSAEMKNNQSVALLRDKNAQAALDAAQGTEVVFAEMNDTRRQGMALANHTSFSHIESGKKAGSPVSFIIMSVPFYLPWSHG